MAWPDRSELDQPVLRQPVLALDTSTERLSVAVKNGADVLSWEGVGGAQSSAQLIPAIERLMQQAGLRYADLACIAFGQGPGAFTGLRTACAVAQGLGFAAGVPLLPVDSLMATAESAWQSAMATHHHPPGWRVLALLDARMDEVYAAVFERSAQGWQVLQDAQLRSPDTLGELISHHAVHATCGNALEVYGSRLGSARPAAWNDSRDTTAAPAGVTAGTPIEAVPRLSSWPAASAMLGLVPHLIAQGHAVDASQAMPRYIRNKVAQTTAEREALKR